MNFARAALVSAHESEAVELLEKVDSLEVQRQALWRMLRNVWAQGLQAAPEIPATLLPQLEGQIHAQAVMGPGACIFDDLHRGFVVIRPKFC